MEEFFTNKCDTDVQILMIRVGFAVQCGGCDGTIVFN